MTTTSPKTRDYPLKPHKFAALFPLMTGQEFDRLVEDIRRHGQQVPITTYRGEILDGRNRYRACEELDIEPVTVEFTGPETPLEFVTSMNLHRRHLSDRQRALIAAKIANALPGVSVKHLRKEQVGIPTVCEVIPIGTAARALNIGRSSVISARVVLRGGTPEEITLAEAGTLPLEMTSKQIRAGVSAEERKQCRVSMPARGARISRTGAAVYAMIAAGEKPKPIRRRRDEPPPEPIVEPTPPPPAPEPTLTERLIGLMRATINALPGVAAMTLVEDTSITPADLDRLAEWLMDVEIVLRRARAEQRGK